MVINVAWPRAEPMVRSGTINGRRCSIARFCFAGQQVFWKTGKPESLSNGIHDTGALSIFVACGDHRVFVLVKVLITVG